MANFKNIISQVDLGYDMSNWFAKQNNQAAFFVARKMKNLSDDYAVNQRKRINFTPYQMKAIQELQAAVAGLQSIENWYLKSIHYAYPGDHTVKIITLQDERGNVERYVKCNGSTVLRKIDESQVRSGEYYLSDNQIIQLHTREQAYADVYNKAAYKLAKSKQKILKEKNKVLEKELHTLSQEYHQILKKRSQNTHSKSFFEKEYHARLERRSKALSDVKNSAQVKQNNYALSLQTRDFMILNNIDYKTFSIDRPVTQFQACLTQEILDIVESSRDFVS
ncbi:MAG: hypothetical protein ACXWL2_04250 [Candidatus Chromulinivorax sp.]